MVYQSPISIVETSQNCYQIDLNKESLKQDGVKQKEVVVVDLASGSTLLKEKIVGEKHVLDLNSLSKGLYTIQVSIGNKANSKKVFVNK